jgi:hypothetical protein
MSRIDIGRKGIFGNPFFAEEPLAGKTLNDYKKYLWNRLKNDENFKEKVKNLLPDKNILWCPGCGPRGYNCAEGVFHGSVLIKAIKYLNEKHDK